MIRTTFFILTCLVFVSSASADTPYDGPPSPARTVTDTYYTEKIECKMELHFAKGMPGWAQYFNIRFGAPQNESVHCGNPRPGSFKQVYTCDFLNGTKKKEFEWYNYGRRSDTCWHILQMLKNLKK
jgi:hypothetical protein